MKILLDTSVCIALMRKRPTAEAHLLKYLPSDCVVSTVVVFELFVGVAKCQEPAREKLRIDNLLRALTLDVFDVRAAKQAARVRADLERVGRMCGPYDLLIAGHALALGLPLATNNVREFSRVSGLQVEDWLA